MARARDPSPLFILVAMIVVVAALYLAKAILLPLALAVLLTFLFTPLANRLEQWRVPRIVAAIIIVIACFGVLVGLGWAVTNQAVSLSQELVNYPSKVLAKVEPLTRIIHHWERTLTDGKTAGEAAGGGPETDRSTPLSPLPQIQEWLASLVVPLTTAGTTTGIVVVLVFFLLLDRENERNRLIQLFGANHLHATTEALHEATQRVGRYLRMLFFVNAALGVAVMLGLSVIGVPGAVVWGVLAFALRFMPYLGVWLAASMPLLVSIAAFSGWTQPLLVLGMFIVYELLLGNVVEPFLYGSSIGVSPVGVIVAAIFWTWLWGPVGLLVAMPLTVCLVVLARYVPQLHFVTVLLAEQPPLSPAERIYQRWLAFDENEPLKLAHESLKSSPLVGFYDNILIPALSLAERARHAGLLNEQQEEFVREAAADLVEELGETHAAASDRHDDSPPVRILCAPLRDDADEIAARMLGKLLMVEGLDVQLGAATSLTSEIVDQAASTKAQVVVISIVPPIRPREARLLWNRLRKRYPQMPIIVGFWGGGANAQSLTAPENDGASRVVTTLSEAVQIIRASAAQLRLAKAV